MTENGDHSVIGYSKSVNRQRVENARFNRDILQEVNLSNYPKLAKILNARRGTRRTRIIVILDYLANEAEESFYLDDEGENGRAFTDIPYAALTAHGGGRETYAAVINLMCSTGLMTKHNPNRIDNEHWNYIDEEARQYAGKQRNRRRIRRVKQFSARIYYHLPKWTPEVLARAEDLAQANTGTLTRVIDVYGIDQAQQQLDTWRRIPHDTERARADIRAYVVSHIGKGYVTRAEILQGVHTLTTREINRRKRIREGKRVPPATGRKTVDLNKILPAYMPVLAEDLNLHYGRPTADQIKRFNLNDRRFILTLR